MSMKSRIGRALAPLIYREGWALIPASRNHDWPQHKFLISFLKRLNVDCVLDVGGNVGQYGKELRMIGYNRIIISFEPDPSCFAELRHVSLKDLNWKVFNIALGDNAGTAKLNVMQMPTFNSFLNPSTKETNSYKGRNEVKMVLDVQVDTLNNIFPKIYKQFGFSRPFLKMDTQGYDLNVFRGASSFHKDIVGVQSELPIKQIYDGMTTLSEAIAEYQSAGYELSGLYPVSPASIELVEMDCYMARSNL